MHIYIRIKSIKNYLNTYNKLKYIQIYIHENIFNYQYLIKILTIENCEIFIRIKNMNNEGQLIEID